MMRTPPIGQTVLRRVNGEWRKDWMTQQRVHRGKDPQDDELSVLVWGATGDRHAPGQDEWREAP